MIPPSFTSSTAVDGAPLTSGYHIPSLSCNGQNVRNNLPQSSQLHEGCEDFEAFNAQDMVLLDQTINNMGVPHVQHKPAATSRSMTPHTRHSTMNDGFQPNNIQPPRSIASGVPPVVAEAKTEFWGSRALSDSQWTILDFHTNSMPASSLPTSTNYRQPTSGHIPRPTIRAVSKAESDDSSSQQLSAPPTPRVSDSHSSPVIQKNFAYQTYPRVRDYPEGANHEMARTNGNTCSRCRTCQNPNILNDPEPERTFPQSPSQASSPSHVQILASCSEVLANLARQLDHRGENEPEQMSRSSKRNKIDREGSFTDGNGNVQGRL